jgi:hypothetical protein
MNVEFETVHMSDKKIRMTLERLVLALGRVVYVDVSLKGEPAISEVNFDIDRGHPHITVAIRETEDKILEALEAATKTGATNSPLYILFLSPRISSSMRLEIAGFVAATGNIAILPNTHHDLDTLRYRCGERCSLESMFGDQPVASEADRFICIGSWAAHRESFSSAFYWTEEM